MEWRPARRGVRLKNRATKNSGVSCLDDEKEILKTIFEEFCWQEIELISDGIFQRIIIEIDIIRSHSEDLAMKIIQNTMKFVDICYDICDSIIKGQHPVLPSDIAVHRKLTSMRPPSMVERNYQISILPSGKSKVLGFKELKSDRMGQLVKITGQCTLATTVEPKLLMGCWVCTLCSSETFKAVSGLTFKPPRYCSASFCRLNKTRGELIFQSRFSKFVSFQTLKISESAAEQGLPKTILVQATDNLTRKARPGDNLTIAGVLLCLQSGSISNLTFYLFSQQIINHSETILNNKLTLQEKICFQENNQYEKMSKSIAPDICGLSDIKKGYFQK